MKQEQTKKKGEERKRIAARTDERTRERESGAPWSQGSNGAVGRAGLMNYSGLVSAHLQKYKRYPADAEARGDKGRATVSFSLDGNGRVTSVRLARSSGVSSLDQEVQAMVRRASPFPAPPDGRSQSFLQSIGYGSR